MRLVDADVLKEKAFGKRGGLLHTSDIDAAPTVDAVPVVKCEDCRFWSKYPGSSAAPQYHECMARISHLGNLYTTAREYCSRGERKDGESE